MKLVLVVRADLGMGRGKLAAQVAHAAVGAALASYGSGDFTAWLADGQPKVVLKVMTAEQLSQTARQAHEARLPVEVVQDAGRTQLVPGTLTCCAIGPAEASRIDAITGGLPLL
ncbi:MAG: peptidyl-tRNA hydrolase Pth2 [Streptosporangiaceae bacterium]|jgi:PTH2 family peptidyl-tRNA hydrolase